VRHGQTRHVLSLTEHVPGSGPTASWSPCAPLAAWRLNAARRVHVRLIVVADEEDIVIAFEHAREAPESNVDGPSVARLRDDANVVHALDLHGGRDAGGDGRRVPEQGVKARRCATTSRGRASRKPRDIPWRSLR